MSLKQISMQAIQDDLDFFGRQSKYEHELQRQQVENAAALHKDVNKAQLYDDVGTGVMSNPLNRFGSRFSLENHNNGDDGHFENNDAYSHLFDPSNLLATPRLATGLSDQFIRNLVPSLTDTGSESLNLRRNPLLRMEPRSLLSTDHHNTQTRAKSSQPLFGHLPYPDSDLLHESLVNKRFSNNNTNPVRSSLDPNISLTAKFTRYSLGLDKYPGSRDAQQCKIPGAKSFELDLLRERQALLRKLYQDIGPQNNAKLDVRASPTNYPQPPIGSPESVSPRSPRSTIISDGKIMVKKEDISTSASQTASMPSLIPIAPAAQKPKAKLFPETSRSLSLASTQASASTSIPKFSDSRTQSVSRPGFASSGIVARPPRSVIGPSRLPIPRPGPINSAPRSVAPVPGSRISLPRPPSASLLSGKMPPFSATSRPAFLRSLVRSLGFSDRGLPFPNKPASSLVSSSLIPSSISTNPPPLRRVGAFGPGVPPSGPATPRSLPTTTTPARSLTTPTKSATPKFWPNVTSLSKSVAAQSPVVPPPRPVPAPSESVRSPPRPVPEPTAVASTSALTQSPLVVPPSPPRPTEPPSASSSPPSNTVAPRSAASVSPSAGTTNPPAKAASASGPGAEYWKLSKFVLKWITGMNKLPPKRRMVYLAKMFLDDLGRTNDLIRIAAKLHIRPCVVTAQMVSEAQHLMLLHQINMASSVWSKRKLHIPTTLTQAPESAEEPPAKKSKTSNVESPSASATATIAAEGGKSPAVLSK